MRAKFVLMIAIILPLSSPAWAGCSDDTIDTVSDDGDLIVLRSGELYDVAAGDQGTASLWREGADVLVCSEKIINEDEDGEEVGITMH